MASKWELRGEQEGSVESKRLVETWLLSGYNQVMLNSQGLVNMEAWDKTIVTISGRERQCWETQLEGQRSCTELRQAGTDRRGRGTQT